MDDLTDATGLSKPSLYSVFGDKQSMFLVALDEEYAELKARLDALKHTASLPLRLAEFLQATAQGYSWAPLAASGIAFGPALADAERDPEIRKRLQLFHFAVEEAASRCFAGDLEPAAIPMISALAISLCARSRFQETPEKDLDVSAIATLLAGRK